MVNTNRDNANYEPLGDNYFQKLNHNSENDIVLSIYGYKENKWNAFLYHFLALILLGIPYLVFKWYPQFQILKYKSCSLQIADFLLLKDNHDHNIILQVHSDKNIFGYNQLRYFIFQNVKYIWVNDDIQFTRLKIPIGDITLNSIHEHSTGVTYQEQEEALKLYGINSITIDVKSYCQLFIDEVFNPFYLFQIFSIGLWSFDEYYIYAGCILFLSLVSIATSLYETKKQSVALHNLVESSNSTIAQVCRPKTTQFETDCDDQDQFNYEFINAALLVPNDLIVLPSDGCVMPCDAVLVNGLCIVNESMLTGESVPVTKTPPNHSDEIFNVELHKRHTIFAGTQVIQTRFYGGNKVLARVVRTGFNTSKGELIKSILYPKPIGLKFYQDSMKFVLFLSLIATTGMAYCIYLYSERKAEIREIFIRALDIITIVVPPALPAAMTVGTIYSQNRLRKNNIFCISPPRINVAGKLKLICFDKTGTLTQDGLEFYGIIPSINNKFVDLIQEPHVLDQRNDVLNAMASCHSLTRIDNVITGDPLDLSMFEATKWELEEPGDENARYDMITPTIVKPKIEAVTNDIPIEELFNLQCEIGILRQFPFTSSQQCMSVICRILGARNMVVFTKGAPEKIQAMCVESSLPKDFSSVLSNYTTSGFRVIALACKQLPTKLSWREALKIKRDLIECELNFLGFIIMQNALKPETTPIINELQSAKIRTVMVTGDNIMTAISVSRDCGMVLPDENILLVKECLETNENPPKLAVELLGSSHQHYQNGDCILSIQTSSRTHIALDGKTWSIIRTHYPTIFQLIVLRGTIFARFRPEQKTQLVTSLQEVDYVVAMCGDGANDCGDVGTSATSTCVALLFL